MTPLDSRLFPQAVAALIERGAFVDYENHAGQTALSVAAEKGVVHGIYALAMCGCTVDYECRNGDTAVLVACRLGRGDSLSALLDNGAKVAS